MNQRQWSRIVFICYKNARSFKCPHSAALLRETDALPVSVQGPGYIVSIGNCT